MGLLPRNILLISTCTLFFSGCGEKFEKFDVRSAVVTGIKSVLQVRAEPDIKAAVLSKLHNGTLLKTWRRTSSKFEVDGIEDHWYFIKTRAGNEGYVFGKYIKKISYPEFSDLESKQQKELAVRLERELHRQEISRDAILRHRASEIQGIHWTGEFDEKEKVITSLGFYVHMRGQILGENTYILKYRMFVRFKPDINYPPNSSFSYLGFKFIEQEVDEKISAVDIVKKLIPIIFKGG